MVIRTVPLLPAGCDVLVPLIWVWIFRLLPELTDNVLRVAEALPGAIPVDVVVIPPAGGSTSQPHWMSETVLVLFVSQEPLGLAGIFPTK